MDAIILNRDDLEQDTMSADFQGYRYGDTPVSFIWVDAPPGAGPRLHRHPYVEVFIVLEGSVTFTVGNDQVAGAAGQVVVVPPNTPHKFINSGTGPLRQIDIHASDHFITEWLED
ncbi:MAG TPA: cupin domain-containing protein [Ktedonobacterales bacterium]|nr:cupin domain-containing protein [Ktedonobacterales bacterium]